MKVVSSREKKAMSDVNEQIADIRERVAVIETEVTHIRQAVEAHNALEKKNGSIVIPVAAVVTTLEIVKVVLEKVF